MNEIIPKPINDFWNPVIDGETFMDFQNYCEEKENLSADDIEIIKENAKMIIQRCIEPNSVSKYKRTNLHIGDVQSGKTLTMAAAIALAHDNNFLLTTLLTGTKTILKAQNESRIESILQWIDKDRDKFYFYKGDDSQLKTQVKQLDRDLRSGKYKTMIVAIILKETKHINDLTTKFQEFNLNEKNFGSIILDDEADQASLNTMIRKQRESPTYKLIKDLIDCHSQFTTFIQVTATANALFCIPSDDELSPQYVSISRRSEKYIGIHTYFKDLDTIKFYVNTINQKDIPEIDDGQKDPPKSLIESLNYFLVACAISRTRGLKAPFTFLCHPDSSTKEHERYRKWIDEYFENLNEILYKEYGESKVLEEVDFNNLINKISSKLGFPNLGDWSQIQIELIRIIEKVPRISIINKDNKILDLKGFWEQSRIHIIIGAMSIERGFTVEGLLVTYLSRNPGTNADNIQQRARFCGYKSKDHLKLSRLWLDEGNLNFYIAALVTENSIRHGLKDHLYEEKPYLKGGFSIPIKKPFRPTRTNIHDVLNTDGIFGWFFPKYAQYLSFEQREKNLNLGMEILEKYNFSSQASKKWRCLASEEMTISDLKVLLNEYQTCEADLNHLAILNTSIQNNLTQFKDSDKILTCLRLAVIKGTERLDEENFSSNPSEYKIKYPTKKNGERIEDYELPMIRNMDRGYDPKKNVGPKKWLEDRDMVKKDMVTLHLNLVRFSIQNEGAYDDHFESDRKLKNYFLNNQSKTFTIHVKFPDLDNWRFYSQ